MKNKPIFEWDAESGIAVCILSDGQNHFVGIARCHADDRDMMNEKTGCNIALMRAEIKYYKHIKNNEIKPAAQALTHVYSTMINSKKFNPNSYESKAIRRELWNKQIELDAINNILIQLEEDLKTMIQEKNKFYQQVRKHRQANSN